jgi:hypothetical protein
MLKLIPSALLLLALASTGFAVAQEPGNGLLVYGALGSAHGGIEWQRVFEHYDDTLITNASAFRPAWELDMASAGIGYHWGETGVLVAGSLPLSETGLYGDYSFTTGPLISLHAVHGATKKWVSSRPVLDAFVGYAPQEMCDGSHVVTGVEATWRFWVVSPSVRAQWVWYFTNATFDANWSNSHTVSLSAGLELGGIWALGHRE